MYITRLGETKLDTYLKENKIIILLGARQVGKTTLIEHKIKDHRGIILNLDIEVDKAKLLTSSHLPLEEIIKNFGNPSLIVIDEAQRLPETGKIVKGWYDAHLPIKIILLGSSSLNLLDQSAESLTGRNIKLYLTPLLFEEVINNQSWYSKNFSKQVLKIDLKNQTESLINQLIVYGSYPETITTLNRQQYLINLISDYLLKDIFQSDLIKSPDTIKKLLLLLAHQIGNEVSINELANNLQISRQTVDKYLNLLEKTFVIFRLPAFSNNQRKEIVKSRKIYFWDTGIRNALLKDFSEVNYRVDIGVLWENWVVAEFAKKNLTEDELLNLYFWRITEGSEVDLVIKGTNTFKAYEIKWSKAKISAKKSFSNKYKIKVDLITKDNVIDFLPMNPPSQKEMDLVYGK